MSFEEYFADMSIGELAEVYESHYGGLLDPPSFAEWLKLIIERWEDERK